MRERELMDNKTVKENGELSEKIGRQMQNCERKQNGERK